MSHRRPVASMCLLGSDIASCVSRAASDATTVSDSGVNEDSRATKLGRTWVVVQNLVVAAALFSAALFFAWWLNNFYPLKHWLFFHYLAIWLEIAVFAVASLSAGWRLLEYLLPERGEMIERVVLAQALGVLAFFYGTFLAGTLHLYGRAFFWVWPALLLAFGMPRLVADVVQVCRGNFGLIVRAAMPRTVVQLIAAIVIVVGLVGLYLQIINPNQLGYDARWYHMPVAEFYVAAGGIRPFSEGWYLGTYPQLGNLLYVWAFEAPGSLFDHVLLCSHLEYLLFAATLLATGVLAARLLKQERLMYAAAVVFLFPEIFAYDSNLNGGTDHVLAFWAPAIGITLVRLGSCFCARNASLAGLMMAGAVLTKYQAAYLLLPSVIFVAVMTIRRRHLAVAAAYCGVAIIASAPHWAKNLIFYHDPFYPLLHHYLPSRPFHIGAAPLFEDVYWPKMFSLQGTPSQKLLATTKALVTFSFIPNDWPEFHGMTPIFGSLFTLMLPVLLVLRATRRLWLMVIGVHLGIATWYVLSHQDRFLQALLPWVAAATAAMLTIAWRRGSFVRLAVATLVALQWAWGADVYFFRSHNMLGDSAIHATTEFLGAAHRGEHKADSSIASTFEKIGTTLPIDSKVLFHRERLRLGLGRQFVEDTPGWQGGIEYLDLDTPRAAWSLLHSLGVTHVMATTRHESLPRADVAREAVFARTMAAFFTLKSSIDGWQVGELSSVSTQETHEDAPTIILWLVCDSDTKPGFYTPRGLAAGMARSLFWPVTSHAASADERLDISVANVAITRSRCTDYAAESLRVNKQFTQGASIGDLTIWVRAPRAGA
jgi:hypothetical protein